MTTIWAVADLLTAFLLLAQFFASGTTFLTVLAAAYAISGLLTVPYLLAFPGLFVSGSLTAADQQISLALWSVWHAAFPIIVGLTIVCDPTLTHRLSSRASVRKGVWITIAATLGIAAILTALVFVERSGLPMFILNGHLRNPFSHVVAPVLIGLNLLACGLIGRRGKQMSCLHLCLLVAMFTTVLDVLLNATTIGRYSYGWDIGKLETVMASSVVLGMLLYEVARDIGLQKQHALVAVALNAVLQARTIEAEAATVSKSQFLANMSHEIRSPMNAILGMLQLLQTTGLSARQADYAAKARTATQALLRLLNDILDFSKIEAGKLAFEKAPFEIDAMMWDVSTLLSASLGGKPVELLFAIDKQLPKRLQGDVFRLRQVLLNLAGNAIKFTAAGEIVIEIRQVAHGPTSCEIEFSIRDTGIGIAPDQLSAIFEGFNQGEASTTRRYGGSGLGLAISQRIVSLMGGQLNVESEVGRGSRFHFTLSFDRAQDCVDGKLPRRLKLASTERERVRVLIVDDNELARAALMNTVQSFGWASDVASSGREVLEVIRESREGRAYDAIFIDWMMPEFDGWETARRIRELLPADDVRVVVMGAAHDLGELSARTQSDPNVVDAVLLKPVTASAVINCMTEMRAKRDRAEVSRDRVSAPRRLSGLKILVVDDFAINLQIAGELLSSEGAEVEIADGGRVAIDTVLRAQSPFDVVLMDVQMPEMDGYETTRRLRELPQMADVAIIAVTANAMESDKAACLAAGMANHLPKPIDIDVVAHAILSHSRPAGAARVNPVVGITAPLNSDVEAALQRLGNNRVLFATIAGRFIDKSDSLIDELRAFLQTGALSDATKLLHQLKGFAGTVGNVPLADLASRLETELKRMGRLPDPLGDVARLESLLASGNVVLAGVIAGFEAGAAAPEIARTLDRTAIESLLAEIDVLLAGANMRAVSVCGDLERSLDAADAQRLTPLAQAIGRLDFARARAELTALRRGFEDGEQVATAAGHHGQ